MLIYLTAILSRSFRETHGMQQQMLLLVAILVVGQPISEVVASTWTTPVKLGPEFNGAMTDFYPFITANSQRFYWSSGSFPDKLGANEDIYYRQWDSSIADWGPRIHLGSEVNTTEREFSPCESPDGRYLWFARYNGATNYDLFYSIRDTLNDTWGIAQDAGPQFNSECFELSVSIAPDGRRMFLSHGKRPGTLGCEAAVLWIAYWNDSTQWWDSLVWLGNTVNQGATQASATMSWDTSYFLISSASIFSWAPTFGGYDLYRIANRAPNWDSLVNLGMPPNSSDRDETVALSSDGLSLYFASTRDPLTSDFDIYVSTNIPDRISESGSSAGELAMDAPFPNPFNSSTSIELFLPSRTQIAVQAFNLLGQKIDDVYEGSLGPGNHRFAWKPKGLPSGIYWLRATTPAKWTTKRILYLK